MEKKRYGKGMRIELTAIVKENGQTRRLFFNFPKQPGRFERVESVFYNLAGWFRAYFKEIDEWTFLRSISKTNSLASERIMDFFVKKIENGELEREAHDRK